MNRTPRRCFLLLVAGALPACVLDIGDPQLDDGPIESATLDPVPLPIHGVDTWWSADGGGLIHTIEQRVQVVTAAPHMFWSLTTFMDQTWSAGRSDDGIAYIGLQTDATRPDGSQGRMAIFSLWNATGSRGGSCAGFGGEGEGLSCRQAFDFADRETYTLRVRAVENDGIGEWWRGELGLPADPAVAGGLLPAPDPGGVHCRRPAGAGLAARHVGLRGRAGDRGLRGPAPGDGDLTGRTIVPAMRSDLRRKLR